MLTLPNSRVCMCLQPPNQVIAEFQKQAGLGPAADAPLSFLDLLGVSRPTLYRNIMDTMRQRLEDRVSMRQQCLHCRASLLSAYH
jgi:hypothetical protein